MSVENRKILGTMSREEYEKIEGISQSELALFEWSPRHYLKRNLYKRKQTKDMKLGTKFHAALLEPKKFKELYTLEPTKLPDGTEINKRVKAHKEYLKGFELENIDRLIVNEEEMSAITGMLNELTETPAVFEIFQNGVPECVATWEYKGVKMKGMADYYAAKSLHGSLCVDAKKTRSARPRDFTRSVFNYNYDLQAAAYTMGFGADRFLFLAVEDKPPHGVGIYDAEMWRELGLKKLDRLIELYLKCQRENSWPSYTAGVEMLQPPQWLAAMGEEDEVYGT